MRYGIDIAWGASTVNARALRASFVARYCSQDTSKILTREEADRYTALGIDVFTVYEDGARDCLGGRAVGRAHAARHLEQARAAGKPDDVGGYYFACDDDFGPADQPAINDYFRGVLDVIPHVETIGVYGSFYVVSRVLRAGLAKLPWQTAAWSGGIWLTPAVQQYSFGQLYDWNRTSRDDFGQWRVGEHRRPTDPNWFLLPDERHWVEVFDHFEGVRRAQHGRLYYWGRTHERHMVRLMSERRKAIWYIAQRTGWSTLNRDLRYRAFRARTDRFAHEEGVHPS